MNIKLALVAIITGLIIFFVVEKKPSCSCNKCTPAPTVQQVAPPPTLPAPVIPKKDPEPLPKIEAKVYAYADGVALAKKLNVKAVVLFGANWCPWCKKMEADTIKQQTFLDAVVKSNIIVIEVNADKDKTTADKYKVSTLPTYVLIDGSENVVKTESGYKNAANFKTWLGVQN